MIRVAAVGDIHLGADNVDAFAESIRSAEQDVDALLGGPAVGGDGLPDVLGEVRRRQVVAAHTALPCRVSWTAVMAAVGTAMSQDSA